MPVNQEKFTRDLLNFFEKAQINCLLFLDKKGNVLNINQAFTENFGYILEDLQGKSFKRLFTEADQLKKKPEKEIESVLKLGQGSDNNYLLAKNGQKLWVSGESILMENSEGKHILKLIQNIDKHKKSELDCVELNEFNENILASVEDAVFVLDSEKKILKYNQVFNKLFKSISKPYTYPKLVKYLKTIEPARAIERNIEKTIGTGVGFKNIPLSIPRFPKGFNTYNVNGNRMEQSNKQGRFLIIIHDITQLKELENEREDLMGFVAHELRSPLANLSLFTQLLENYLAEAQIEKAKSILSNAKKNIVFLNNMVAELNSSTKIHSGIMELNKTTFNFSVLVKEVSDSMKAHHPYYIFHQNEVGKIHITADKFRVMEVITNYLSNAVKYSSGSNQLFLFTKIKNKHLIFSIKDNGPGISKEELPFIFSRFFRAERTKRLEGIGLGLYLCEKIIKAHGGKVWVESELGLGSEFYFSIPLDD